MKLLKTLFLNLFIAYIFLGNVGLSVFTHSCKEDGIFRSYVFNSVTHCKEEKPDSFPSCCGKIQKSQHVQLLKEDCCKDQADIYQIKLDYHQDHSFSSVQLDFFPEEFQYTHYFARNTCKEISYNFNIHPPPIRLWGKEILIRHQVFLL